MSSSGAIASALAGKKALSTTPAIANVNNSTPGAAKAAGFKEINQLKAQLAELQVKYENQQLLLEKHSSSLSTTGTTEEQRAEQALQQQGVESSSAGTAAGSSAAGASSPSATAPSAHHHSTADFLQLQQANHFLQSQAQSFQSSLLQQSEELQIARSEKASLSAALHEKDQSIDGLMKELLAAREEVAGIKGEQGESNTLVEKLSSTITGYEQKLESYEARILSMDAEFKHLKALQQEKTELEALVEKLRALLLQTSKDASKKNQELLNALQATRQFLEELKAEYESFAVNTRVEHDLYKRSKGKELQQLQEKLDHMKLSHYESSQEIHREQIEIIENLQANYLEYRLMVENLFYAEARALEEKLTAQQHKYETEIKYILRMKDHQFHTMITSKDAKIMMLIEGTDFSRILMKHQMELEGLKKSHEREIDSVRESASLENKKMVIDLKRDLIARQTEIDKYHTQILTWEKKLEQTLALLKKQKKLHAMKEESSEKHAKEVQLQLNKAYTQIESLIQVKENLRHRILRLRLQIEGTADDSVPSIIKRLTKETKRLATDLSMVSFNYKTRSDAHDQAEKRNARLDKQVGELERELAHRTKEYKALVQTYESYLNGRLRSGVTATTGRASMYDPSVTSLLETLSQPFLEALYAARGKNGGGNMKETLMRATQIAAGNKPMEQTMVGLRIGPPQPQQPEDEKESHARHDSSTSQQLIEDASRTKRRSVVFDQTTAAAIQADLESSTLTPGQPRSANVSARGSRAPSVMGDSLNPTLPSASHLSKRNSPMLAPPSAGTQADGLHGRHVSLNTFPGGHRRFRSEHSVAADGLDIPQQALQSGELTPQEQEKEYQQHLQQAQQYLLSQRAPSAAAASQQHPDDVVLSGADALSASRASRLHSLIKHSGYSAPPAVMPGKEARSMREVQEREGKERRKEEYAQQAAAAAATTAAAAAVTLDDDDLDSNGRKRKKKASRVLAYKPPKSLIDIENAAEFVDLHAIKSLERGFSLLSRFKATSAAFENDARGRLAREGREEQERMGGAGGIGGFRRSDSHSTFQPSATYPDHAHPQDGATFDRHTLLEQTGRVGADALVDVTEKAMRVYGGTNTTTSKDNGASVSFNLNDPAEDVLEERERKDAGAAGDDDTAPPASTQRISVTNFPPSSSNGGDLSFKPAALSLNLLAYTDPAAQLVAMQTVGGESAGEEASRLYQPASASVVPWWSSAAGSLHSGPQAAPPANVHLPAFARTQVSLQHSTQPQQETKQALSRTMGPSFQPKPPPSKRV